MVHATLGRVRGVSVRFHVTPQSDGTDKSTIILNALRRRMACVRSCACVRACARANEADWPNP